MDPSPSFYCHSVVRSVCIRQAVRRGTVLALIGTIPLMLAGILVPSQILHGWGILLLTFFLFCVTIGLLPYKRLTRKQLHPDLLYVDGPSLVYATKGWHPKIIPLRDIIASYYVLRSEGDYGVEVVVKTNLEPEKRFFFPYFTQETSRSLEELIHDM